MQLTKFVTLFVSIGVLVISLPFSQTLSNQSVIEPITKPFVTEISSFYETLLLTTQLQATPRPLTFTPFYTESMFPQITFFTDASAKTTEMTNNPIVNTRTNTINSIARGSAVPILSTISTPPSIQNSGYLTEPSNPTLDIDTGTQTLNPSRKTPPPPLTRTRSGESRERVTDIPILATMYTPPSYVTPSPLISGYMTGGTVPGTKTRTLTGNTGANCKMTGSLKCIQSTSAGLTRSAPLTFPFGTWTSTSVGSRRSKPLITRTRVSEARTRGTDIPILATMYTPPSNVTPPPLISGYYTGQTMQGTETRTVTDNIYANCKMTDLMKCTQPTSAGLIKPTTPTFPFGTWTSPSVGSRHSTPPITRSRVSETRTRGTGTPILATMYTPPAYVTPPPLISGYYTGQTMQGTKTRTVTDNIYANCKMTDLMKCTQPTSASGLIKPTTPTFPFGTWTSPSVGSRHSTPPITRSRVSETRTRGTGTPILATMYTPPSIVTPLPPSSEHLTRPSGSRAPIGGTDTWASAGSTSTITGTRTRASLSRGTGTGPPILATMNTPPSYVTPLPAKSEHLTRPTGLGTGPPIGTGSSITSTFGGSRNMVSSVFTNQLQTGSPHCRMVCQMVCS